MIRLTLTLISISVVQNDDEVFSFLLTMTEN